MKLSVSVSDDEVEFIDSYLKSHQLPSRSAVFQLGIKLLRDLQLQDSYEQAFSDEERYEDPAILEHWHQMAEAARERMREAASAPG